MWCRRTVSQLFQWLKSEYDRAERSAYTFNPHRVSPTSKADAGRGMSPRAFAVEKRQASSGNLILLAIRLNLSTLIRDPPRVIGQESRTGQRFVTLRSSVGTITCMATPKPPPAATRDQETQSGNDRRPLLSLKQDEGICIVDSGDTSRDGSGAMTDARAASFFDTMVRAAWYAQTSTPQALHASLCQQGRRPVCGQTKEPAMAELQPHPKQVGPRQPRGEPAAASPSVYGQRVNAWAIGP